MQMIPVLDVMNGQVVRAVGGRREAYRPLQSQLTNSLDPVVVARELIEKSGAKHLYCADLDAITRGLVDYSMALRIVAELHVKLLLDVGLRTEADLDSFPVDERLIPVVGSETLATPEDGGAAQVFEGRVAFSVDLRDGHLLGAWENWGDFEVEGPRAVAELARAGQAITGADTILLIDVSQVGSGRGVWAEELCREIKRSIRSRVDLFVGGGIRHWDDVRRIEDAGADGVLVASAIHSGTLTFPRPAS